MATAYSNWKWNNPGTVAWRVAVDYNDAATSAFTVRVEVTGGSLWMRCTCTLDGNDSGWGTKTYNATSGFTFGTTGNWSRGSNHTFSVTCTGGSWGQNGTLSVTIPALNYSVQISHWTWGYINGEGNNEDKTAFTLGNTSFSVSAGSSFTMDSSRAVSIPNGFSLEQSCGGSSYAGTWTNYSFPAKFTADRNSGFEYDYTPISYIITYTMNGGVNSSSNPTSYNVLYGITFANPSRTGYTFKNWTIGGTVVTGINPGANANFSSPDDLRNKINSRTTGNKTVVANWTANTYTVTFDKQSGSGGTTSVGITYDTPQGSYPNIILPTRTGYHFGGYYTETGGKGTQYYNANGDSVRAWNIASNITLYAYWIPNDLRINIGDTWKYGEIYVNVAGTWKRATAVYININNIWKQISG